MAAADSRVLLVETPALPSLGTRIVLHGAGDVDVRTIAASDLPAAAPALLAEHDAVLVLWVDAQQDRVFVVYAAGRSPDRAVIELVRIGADTPPSEIERIVSLKIIGLLDAVLAPEPVATVLGVPAASVNRWRLGVGITAAAGTADRALAIGPMLIAERRWDAIAIGATARMLLANTVDDRIATTAIDEYGLAAGAELARGPAFATAGFAGTLLRARAATIDGRRGNATEIVPLLRAGVGVRLPLSAAQLVVGVDVEYSVIHQRFLVDGTVVADLGRVRGVASVAVSLPLR